MLVLRPMRKGSGHLGLRPRQILLFKGRSSPRQREVPKLSQIPSTQDSESCGFLLRGLGAGGPRFPKKTAKKPGRDPAVPEQTIVAQSRRHTCMVIFHRTISHGHVS